MLVIVELGKMGGSILMQGSFGPGLTNTPGLVMGRMLQVALCFVRAMFWLMVGRMLARPAGKSAGVPDGRPAAGTATSSGRRPARSRLAGTWFTPMYAAALPLAFSAAAAATPRARP